MKTTQQVNNIPVSIFIGLTVIVFAIFACKNKSATSHNEESKSDLQRPLLKEFVDLTPSDFTNHAVWVQVHVIDYDEEWYEETDEEIFRPWIGEIPVDHEYAIFLVKAKFTLNDGSEFDGFITPQKKSSTPDLGMIQPYLFTNSGKMVSFWSGVMDLFPEETVISYYKSLGKNADEVFPIQFKAQDGLAKGIISGTIPGFCGMGENDEIIIKK